MFEWPSIASELAVLRHEEYRAEVKLGVFGGFSEKATALAGSWRGIPVLALMQQELQRASPARELLKLTDESRAGRLVSGPGLCVLLSKRSML